MHLKTKQCSVVPSSGWRGDKLLVISDSIYGDNPSCSLIINLAVVDFPWRGLTGWMPFCGQTVTRKPTVKTHSERSTKARSD